MRFRTDDRGVTVQIGTVLLFAVLIVLLSTYQATVVPQQNEQVEFNHNQRVQGDLHEFRDELLRTTATDSGATASVELGTRYPERALFVNPPPPAGTLRTTPPANVTVENATAVGETGDYWNGSRRNFSTRGVTYDPLYHVYQNSPTTVYANGVLYNEFEDANVTLAGQRLVRGNRISLVAVNGSLSESGSETASVDVRAVSAATRSVTVRNESDPVSVVLPTRLPEDEAVGLWRQSLEGETVDNGGRVKRVEKGPNEDIDDVRIVLEPGTYELRLAKVGVGSDVSGVVPHYVTDVRGDNESVAEGTTEKLVVEVRDRYNNPVSDARVNLSLVSDESEDTLVHLGESADTFSDLRTDSEGQVTVRFEAGEFDGNTREEEVRASVVDVPNGDFDSATKENLTFNLRVYGVGGPGNGNGGGGGGGGGDQPRGVTYTGDYRTLDGTQGGVESVLQVELENELPEAVELTAMKVNHTTGPASLIREVRSGVGEVEIDVDGDGNSDSTTDRRSGYDVGERIALDERATMDGESTAVVQFYEFRKQNGDPVDMNGRRVTLTVYYETADGEAKASTVTVNT